eukprot:TRINITY_DN26724_c0_g1_i1.p1 TRINITY_DN26724_c0_g1~~TRINITY_DN26724_c0_g1_i1.p1  ORF type:complete len:819 (-),score=204.24 TRINITY_DN26724_c0_g1_i1:43-2499(-)
MATAGASLAMDGNELVPPRAGMDSDWARANPDRAEDLLPQPFRRVNELVEEILDAVNDRIDEILTRQRSPEHEPGLPQYSATAEVQVSGQVTCAASDVRGTSLAALGTRTGTVMLVETRGTPAIAAQKTCLQANEAVVQVVLTSDGSLRVPRPQGLDYDQFSANVTVPKKGTKLLVSGTMTPEILVFDVVKDTYSAVLSPNCVVEVPPAPTTEDADGEARATRPPVEQLRAVGVDGAVLVLVLLPDRTLRAFRIPLSERPRVEEGAVGAATSVKEQVIREEDEAEEDDDASLIVPGDEFKGLPRFSTATYHFSLPLLAPLADLPEPELEEVCLLGFAPRPDGSIRGFNRGNDPVPAYCFVASPVSGAVVAYAFRPRASITADLSAGLDALLREPALTPGSVVEPESSEELQPYRRFDLPSRTTASASSPRGGFVAVGGEQGTLALITVGAGIHLCAVLPGHYAAVAALAFHGEETLVSLGADGWVQHYDTATSTVRSRHLCTPPPDPPPGLAVVAVSAYPMALSLDAVGNMRLLDVRRGQKLARASCIDDSADAMAGTAKPPGAPFVLPGQRVRLLATAGCFCAMAETFDPSAALLAQSQGTFSRGVSGATARSYAMTNDLDGGNSQQLLEGDEPSRDESSLGYGVSGMYGMGAQDTTTIYFFDAAGVPDASPPVLSAAVLPASADASPARGMGPLGDSPQKPKSPSAGGSVAAGSVRSSLKSSAAPFGRSVSIGPVVELTEENLTFLKTGRRGSMDATGGGVGADGGAEAHAARGVPLSWDALVKQRLRNKRIDKNVRHARIAKRLDAIKQSLVEIS